MTRVNIAQPDVTLTLDLDGVIRGATLSDAIPGEQMPGLARPPLGRTPSAPSASTASATW